MATVSFLHQKKIMRMGRKKKKRYLVASILIRLIERCLCSANQSIDPVLISDLFSREEREVEEGGGVRLKMLMESLTGNYGNDK